MGDSGYAQHKVMTFVHDVPPLSEVKDVTLNPQHYGRFHPPAFSFSPLILRPWPCDPWSLIMTLTYGLDISAWPWLWPWWTWCDLCQFLILGRITQFSCLNLTRLDLWPIILNFNPLLTNIIGQAVQSSEPRPTHMRPILLYLWNMSKFFSFDIRTIEISCGPKPTLQKFFFK